MGRKRVLTSQTSTAPKRKRAEGLETESSNIIESLPQEVLVNVMCKTAFKDLSNLLLVSKSFNQAAVMAKEVHPCYNTPAKPDSNGVTNMENDKSTPNVVIKRVRHSYSYRGTKPKLGKDFARVSVLLFHNDEE